MRNKGWQGPLPIIAAVVIVATLSLLTVTVMSGFGPEEDDLALLDTEGYSSTSTTSTTVRRSTTTTTRPTTTLAPRPSSTEAPEVLGAVTQRDPGATTTTSIASGAAAPSPAPSPAPSGPAPTPATAPPTTSAPSPTTTIVCRNSTDPACGPLQWDPEPAPYEVEVYALSTPAQARVGQRVVFAVNQVEPAGDDALGACATWQVSDPGVSSVSSCEAINHSCGRYGPHDPPAPSRKEITVGRTITFTTPGEHTVTVSAHTATNLADGCASPYLESWTRTFRILVTED